MRLLVALLMAGACATEPDRDRGPQRSDAILARNVTPGECEPVEYTLAAPSRHDAVVRVAVSAIGRAGDAVLLATTGSEEDDELALEAVREVFHCRNLLAPSAARALDYRVHFTPVEKPQVDASCLIPTDLPYPSQEAPLDFRVALDERGFVQRVWSHSDFEPWALPIILDSIERRCRFTPARVDGTAVPFVARYTFRYHERPKHFR
jgi:hypothetical protein